MAEEHETERLRLATAACHVGSEASNWKSRDLVPPISMATIFLMEDPSISPLQNPYIYTRVNNPTRNSLEQCLAAVEGANHARCFSSGMAALTAAIFLLRAHDHIICCADVYGGTYRFLNIFAQRMAIDTSFVDCVDVNCFRKAFQSNTKMVLLETVSNPTMKVLDLKRLVAVTREQSSSVLIVLDNTFLTPVLLKPLDYGVDIVLHSLTKYMNGHSDVLMGSLAFNDPQLAQDLSKRQLSLGAVPSPMDCFLVNRSLRTLEIRVLKHAENGLQVARALASNPRVESVLHLGLPSHPQHQQAKELLPRGFCGVFSFYVRGSGQQTKLFLTSLKLIALAFSLGGHESVIELPREMTHNSMTEEVRQTLGITDNLLRISIGLEDPRDLIADLEQALKLAIPL